MSQLLDATCMAEKCDGFKSARPQQSASATQISSVPTDVHCCTISPFKPYCARRRMQCLPVEAPMRVTHFLFLVEEHW